MQGAPQGLIFDLDGTLVSSALDFKRIREEVACPQDVDLLVHIETLDTVAKRAAHEVIRRHETRDAENCRLMPGVWRSLSLLRQHGMPMAVVTRNSRVATEQKLRATGLHFDMVLTREDAPPKPEPAALLEVAERWSLSAEDCVYLGDFRYDLDAARAAGMHAWLYAPGLVPDYGWEADLILRHFSELPAVLQTLGVALDINGQDEALRAQESGQSFS